MNNGFSGSYTAMGNNMALSCQPNFNGSQPGHCLLHHVTTTPTSDFSQHFNFAHNSAMDFARIDQMNDIKHHDAIAQRSASHHRLALSSNTLDPTNRSARRLLELNALKEKIGDRIAQRRMESATQNASASIVKTKRPEANDSKNKNPAHSPSLTIRHNFLSNEQRVLKDKDLVECPDGIRNIGVEAKWIAIDLAQGISFGAGMVAGIPAGFYEAVDGIVQTASSPAETYQALKSLCQSGNVLSTIGDAFKQSWINSIDRMEANYQKGGISGSFHAGVEGGKLITDIAGGLAGGAGILRGGAVVTEKLVTKIASKAEIITTNPGNTAVVNFAHKVLGEYSAMKSGPLESNLAETFSGAKYKEVTLKEDIILYRGGTPSNPLSPYFSTDRPEGIIQTRIDKAILPVWPKGAVSKIDSSIAIKVPAGTKVYVGNAGFQNDLYVGGTQQIVIPKIKTLKNVEIVEIRPLK